MYKTHPAVPKKFGSHTSTFKTPARSSGGKPRFGSGKFNNSRPRTFRKSGGGGGGKRFSGQRGQRIDFSRFIKKGVYVEEKPYVSKHTFADFPFNPQLHKNIAKAGYIHPRPIQDQSIPTILQGKDVFGMANTGTARLRHFSCP
jgi:hypothetical protein